MKRWRRVDSYLPCSSDDFSQQTATLRLIGAHWGKTEHLLTLPILQRHPHTTSQVVTLNTRLLTQWHSPSQKHPKGQLRVIVSARLENSSFPPSHSCVLLVYYRIYAEDGAIHSKKPVAPDPFLGRIKAISVPPPHTAKNVKRSIAKVECIEDHANSVLFLTQYSQSPTGDTDKIAILNRTGPGSTPHEPLALVVKKSDSDRLESEGRAELASAADPDTVTSEIRYRGSIQHFLTSHLLTSRLLGEVHYLLYADGYEMTSKVAIDPERPSLGRIRIDSVPPPHSPATIKRCISRVERTPELAYADLFADISSDTPLKEDYISILTDGPGMSPNEPMAIVQVESPTILDGKYCIKNRAGNFYWSWGDRPLKELYFRFTQIRIAKHYNYTKVNEHSPII